MNLKQVGGIVVLLDFFAFDPVRLLGLTNEERDPPPFYPVGRCLGEALVHATGDEEQPLVFVPRERENPWFPKESTVGFRLLRSPGLSRLQAYMLAEEQIDPEYYQSSQCEIVELRSRWAWWTSAAHLGLISYNTPQTTGRIAAYASQVIPFNKELSQLTGFQRAAIAPHARYPDLGICQVSQHWNTPLADCLLIATHVYLAGFIRTLQNAKNAYEQTVGHLMEQQFPKPIRPRAETPRSSE